MNWTESIPRLPQLAKGSHDEASGQRCAMELVAFMERLPHSDSPPCTCPVLASFVRALNDRMPNGRRNDLLPILPRLVGTVNPALARARGWLFAMRMVTDLVPIALDGVIAPHLVAAMRDAKDLKAAANAADAAAYAAYVADAAAKAAAYAAANAADAAANAANAAAAVYAAANAADAAAKAAAYAAANAANAAAKHDFWSHAIRILSDAIDLGTSKPAQWTPSRMAEAVQ